jgi:hypothetical protein
VQTPWPPLIAEARAVLPAFRQACAPASRRVVGDWFLGINLAVGNPVAATDYDFRLVLIQDACSDLPGCVFNAETRREARAKVKCAFPSVYYPTEPKDAPLSYGAVIAAVQRVNPALSADLSRTLTPGESASSTIGSMRSFR